MTLEDLILESIRAGAIRGDRPEVRLEQCAKIPAVLKEMGHDDGS